MPSATNKLATSTNPASKGTLKDKKSRCQKKPTDNSFTARLTHGSGTTFGKRRNSFDISGQDPDDEPTVKKSKQTLDMRSPGTIIDFDGLCRPGNGTRSRINEAPQQTKERLEKMRSAVRTLLECVGEDPDREGLQATPLRYAKALLFLTKGYEVNLEKLVNNALFHEGHTEMVIVKDIEIYSLCEHHLVPFAGKVNSIHSIYILLPETNQNL